MGISKNFAKNMTKLAKRLTNEAGNSISAIFCFNCVYSTTEGEYICDETIYPFKGTVSNYTIGEQNNPNIQTGDMKVLVATDLKITQSESDSEKWEMEYDGKRWQILASAPTTSQDLTIKQDFQIRSY